MEELELGPNGALLYSMEYLARRAADACSLPPTRTSAICATRVILRAREHPRAAARAGASLAAASRCTGNGRLPSVSRPVAACHAPAQEDNLHEWLQDELDAFADDDYVLFDCPGQACRRAAPRRAAQPPLTCVSRWWAALRDGRRRRWSSTRTCPFFARSSISSSPGDGSACVSPTPAVHVLGTHTARGCGCPLARRRRGHRDGCGSVCAVYLLDAQFVTDVPKYIAGSMACLSAMMQLELPHVNVLTKVDMLKDSDVNFEKCARSVQRREHRCLRAR